LKELTLKDRFYITFADFIFQFNVESLKIVLGDMGKELNQDIQFKLNQDGTGYIGYPDKENSQPYGYPIKEIIRFKDGKDFVKKLKEWFDNND
jgi:hypothetical protein